MTGRTYTFSEHDINRDRSSQQKCSLAQLASHGDYAKTFARYPEIMGLLILGTLINILLVIILR